MLKAAPQIKISILVITYNHEKYLAQALESILTQKVQCQIEIIIADDCSTDNTLTIAKDFHAKNPELIRILSTNKNLGHTRNYARAWEAATGEYIAHCDGDDYWTDPLKLSKQLNFLESHPSFSTCGHKVWAISEEDGSHHGPIPRVEESIFNTEELLEACYPHNCSLLFRNRLFTQLPDFFFNLTGHDWCITLLNSLHGDIKVLPEPMGVWRMRTDGLWGGRNGVFHLQHNLKFLENIKSLLPKPLHKTATNKIIKNTFWLSEAFLKEGNIIGAQKSFSQIPLFKSCGLFPLKKWLSLTARIKTPRTYQFLISLRDFISGKHLASENRSL